MTGRRQPLLVLGVLAATLVVGAWTPLLGGPIKVGRPGHSTYERPGHSTYERPGHSTYEDRFRVEKGRSNGGEPIGHIERSGYGADAPHEPTREQLELEAKFRERESIGEHTLPGGKRVGIVADLPFSATNGVARANVSSTIATLVIMAESSEGFRNMFGEEPTAGQSADIHDFLSKYTAAGAQVISDDAERKNALVEALKATVASHEATIIVGHAVRDNGVTLLVLPDGTRVSTEELAGRVPEANIVFLTCYSRDLDPDSAISLNEAFAVWGYATSSDRTKPAPSVPLRDAPAGTDVPPVAAIEERIDALVVRAGSQSSEHPRVGVMWTSIDHGHGRWLVEVTRDTEPDVSRLLMIAPAVFGHTLLILLMIVIPKVGGNQSLKTRLLIALQRRRRAVTLSAFGLIASVSGYLVLTLWRYLEHVGNPEPVPPLAVWAGGIGTAQAALGCIVARTTPFGSLLGRVIHSLAGAIVGVWKGLGAYFVLIVEYGKGIAIAALIIGVIVGWVAGDGHELMALAVSGGAFLIALPVLIVIYCALSAAAAGKGESVFG